MVAEKYIHFDWAVKRMLRDKANFGVLEGLLTVLLEEKNHHNRKSKGNSLEDISEITGLSIDEIKKTNDKSEANESDN